MTSLLKMQRQRVVSKTAQHSDEDQSEIEARVESSYSSKVEALIRPSNWNHHHRRITPKSLSDNRWHSSTTQEDRPRSSASTAVFRSALLVAAVVVVGAAITIVSLSSDGVADTHAQMNEPSEPPPIRFDRSDSGDLVEVAGGLADKLPFILTGRRRTPVSRLPSSYNGRISLFLFSSSEPIPPSYSLDLSTQENYSVRGRQFHGKFKKIRASLDYSYHGNYNRNRQEFQDKIIEKMLEKATVYDTQTGRICKVPTRPWAVFTAGVMGAGKSHTLKQLASKGLFPLQSFVIVDPDEIRSHFPEYHLYATSCPKRAGDMTHREAGYISEIITAAAMNGGYNVLVDGSLRDHEWYKGYFESLRKQYRTLRIAILHIVAPRDAIFKRAMDRAKDTGRVVPIKVLEMSLMQVPTSVKILAPAADFFCEIDNSLDLGEVTMKTEGIDWDSFRDNWVQHCRLIPWLS